MDPILRKFRDKFYEEANTLLDRLEKDMLELEKMSDNKELIESAFRVMHTIKGVSGMYGFEHISDFTHNMESLYTAVRDGKIDFDKEIFDLTFLSIDHIRKLLSDEKLEEVDNQSTHNMLLGDIQRKLASDTSFLKPVKETKTTLSTDEKHTWHILVKTNESMYFRGINLLNIFSDLSNLGEYEISRLDYIENEGIDIWSIMLSSTASEEQIREVFLFIEDDCTITCISEQNIIYNEDFYKQYLENEPDNTEQSIIEFIENSGKQPISEISNYTSSETKNSVSKKVASLKAERNQSIKRISVDSVKLDHLMYLVSELITVNSQLLLATRDRTFESIRPLTEKVDTLSKQFRTNALEIRLVPLSDTILRFQRLIRDLSQQLNKKIELVTQGIDTELDKNTIDQLNEPLMHIIRNCIDHGIELPENRLKKGKAETGILKISAYNSGNYVVIKVEDDGNGINLEKVRLKAVDRGIIKPADKPGKKELFDYIFMPGFSTAQSLTEVSGRGVGLDVVKRKILDLRGDVTIESEEGHGTAFILKLQQSLAITDTLLFKVEGSHFIVPISDIKLCSQFNYSEIQLRKHTGTIPFEDSLIPFIDLRERLMLDGQYEKKIKAIIIRAGDQYVALLADAIVGEHQAVLKPLGKSFRNQEYITAASQLGDGGLAFLLDTYEIIKQTTLEYAH